MEALLLQSGAARQKSMGRMAHADLVRWFLRLVMAQEFR